VERLVLEVGGDCHWFHWGRGVQQRHGCDVCEVDILSLVYSPLLYLNSCELS